MSGLVGKFLSNQLQKVNLSDCTSSHLRPICAAFIITEEKRPFKPFSASL